MNTNKKVDNASKRSKQNLSCNWTGSADFGRLVPIHWEELLKGDHVVKFSPRIEMQMLPFASPTFGKIEMYCHCFVVPIRQLQKNFYDIWSQVGVYKEMPLSFTTPKSLVTAFARDIYQDPHDVIWRGYFKHFTSLGLNPFFMRTPQEVSDNETAISLYPWLAYNKIWWDFYRDPEVLRDENKDDYIFDGDLHGELPAGFVTKYMCPHVRSIKNNWISNLFTSPGAYNTIQNDSIMPFPRDTQLPYNQAGYAPSLDGPQAYVDNDTSEGMSFGQNPDGSPASTANTSRMLRLTEALSRLAERLSLSGKRQIEQLFARYGVKPEWSKMNLCQYVGGAKSEVLVDNIVSSAETEGMPLGAQAGKGYCALDSLNVKVSVDEPSIFMCILSVMPRIHFVQGLSKKFQRRQLSDMFQESLQYVGQVAVAKREIGMNYGDMHYNVSEDAETFAFCDPYYEYKTGLDILAGDFMWYHDSNPSDTDIKYMQSMEQYIDYPEDRLFNLDNMLIDGDKYNKIFKYLGGGSLDDVDDHFHVCVDKEIIIDRPMDGYPIPTLETTQEPHVKKQVLSNDVVL